jgi:shikimate kinase
MTIFLIGFMGSGKTYWGKIWAVEYGMHFADLDEIIEAAQKRTIAEIFEKDGEDHFRQLESMVLRTGIPLDHSMVSCGGGTACFGENMQWMNENGITIYLHASPQYIYNRILEEKDKRPLIKKLNPAELLFFIEQKLKEREPFYSMAQYRLNVDELNTGSLVNIIHT